MKTCLQGEKVRTIVGDPQVANRRKDKQNGTIKQVLMKARRAVKSASRKALLKKRGEHVERRFAHVLDQSGLRRTTLRGEGNLTKRHLATVLAYDLSLLMRHLTGHGAEAMAGRGGSGLVAVGGGNGRPAVHPRDDCRPPAHGDGHYRPESGQDCRQMKNRGFSTGC